MTPFRFLRITSLTLLKYVSILHVLILVFQLSDAEYAQINMALPSGWDEDVPDKHLRWQRLQINEPFQVKLKNGLVSKDKLNRNTYNNP
jgi:hypothetical protein